MKWQPGWPVLQRLLRWLAEYGFAWSKIDKQTRVLFNTDSPRQSKIDNKDAEANKI